MSLWNNTEYNSVSWVMGVQTRQCLLSVSFRFTVVWTYSTNCSFENKLCIKQSVKNETDLMQEEGGYYQHTNVCQWVLVASYLVR